MEPQVASKFMAFDDYKPDFPSTAATLHPTGSIKNDHRVAAYGTYEHNTPRRATLLTLTESGESQSPDDDVKVTDDRFKFTGTLVKVGAVALGVAALAGIAALAYRKLV